MNRMVIVVKKAVRFYIKNKYLRVASLVFGVVILVGVFQNTKNQELLLAGLFTALILATSELVFQIHFIRQFRDQASRQLRQMSAQIEQQRRFSQGQAKKVIEQAKKIDEQAKKVEGQAKYADAQAKKIADLRSETQAHVKKYNSEILDLRSFNFSTDIAAVIRSLRNTQPIDQIDWLQESNEHGHEMMSLMISETFREENLKDEQKVLIEIGTTRELIRNQRSTQKFAILSAVFNLRFITVDMDENNTNAVRPMLNFVWPQSTAIAQKGEDFLAEYQGKIDFAYLDAFDFYHEHHSNQRKSSYERVLGVEITNENCWEMHLKCAESLAEKMVVGGVVVFDDTWVDDQGDLQGKGKTAIPYLLKRGFVQVAQNEMTVGLKRIS